MCAQEHVQCIANVRVLNGFFASLGEDEIFGIQSCFHGGGRPVAHPRQHILKFILGCHFLFFVVVAWTDSACALSSSKNSQHVSRTISYESESVMQDAHENAEAGVGEEKPRRPRLL